MKFRHRAAKQSVSQEGSNDDSCEESLFRRKSKVAASGVKFPHRSAKQFVSQEESNDDSCEEPPIRTKSKVAFAKHHRRLQSDSSDAESCHNSQDGSHKSKGNHRFYCNSTALIAFVLLSSSPHVYITGATAFYRCVLLWLI